MTKKDSHLNAKSVAKSLSGITRKGVTMTTRAGKAGTVTEAECRVAKDQFCTNVRIAPDSLKDGEKDEE
jgi:hypothetical protein